jgi:hypothetical protein
MGRWSVIPEGAQYWRGIIRRDAAGHAVYLHALRSTAELYGWTTAFYEWREAVRLPITDPQGRIPFSRGKTGSVGGRQCRISRSPVKQGSPAGMTNAFRIAKQATELDWVLLAEGTRGDWCWMTDRKGIRVNRAAWLEAASRIPIAFR